MTKAQNFVHNHLWFCHIFALCLIIVAVILGVLWFRNPQGNYEPLIFVLTSLAALIGVPSLVESFRPAKKEEPPAPELEGIRDAREALRQRHQVRRLRELESGHPLSRLSSGIYGFTVPWAIKHGEEMDLSRENGGTSAVEIHKLNTGEILVVGFVSQDNAIRIENGIGDMSFPLFTELWEEASTLVAIPLVRILQAEEHSFRNGFVINLALSSPIEEENTKESIRQRHKVRRLNSQENKQPLSSLPSGVFGFVTPLSLKSREDDLSLSAHKADTSELEIHKLSPGEVLAVGYVSRDNAFHIERGIGEVSFQFFTEPWQEARTLVAIPLRRILQAENRGFGNVSALEITLGRKDPGD